MTKIFQAISRSRTGSSIGIYSRFILPVYFKIFLKKCQMCKNLTKLDFHFKHNSLINEIGADLNRALAFIFLACYVMYYLLFVQYIQITRELFWYGTLFVLLSYAISFFILNMFLLRSLNKNIVRKVDHMKYDMDQIKEGDWSKRIEIGDSVYELSELVYFTNNLLDKLESTIEHEKKQALIDPLTSCYNRRAMNINYDYIRKKAMRDDKQFAVVVLDLDYFKKVNDTYGHKTGDEILIHLVKIIQETIRNHDFIYRIGGEEFVVLFTNIKKAETVKLINRLRKQITYKLKKAVPGIEEDITVSGGFVMSTKYDLEKKTSLDKMIDDADKLLYKAKKTGRDKVLG